MYPTIYLIILLSVQETPKVLANQISVHMRLGQAKGGNAFTALPEILLTEQPTGIS